MNNIDNNKPAEVETLDDSFDTDEFAAIDAQPTEVTP